MRRERPSSHQPTTYGASFSSVLPRAVRIARRPSAKPELRPFVGGSGRAPGIRARGRRREWIDSFVELLPETHKDHKRVPNLNGRSLILVGIPDSLSWGTCT